MFKFRAIVFSKYIQTEFYFRLEELEEITTKIDGIERERERERERKRNIMKANAFEMDHLCYV